MTPSALQAGLLLGVLLGMRHALEPDHLAAVSTLVTRQRNARAGLWVGVLWGIGHTLALLAVGLVLGLLHAELPSRLADAFELCVAVMLVVLGSRSVLRAARMGESGPVTEHEHRGLAHTHAAGGSHVHIGRVALAPQPLLVGLVHGLAGSGALTALALAHMPTALGRALFMALFGCGSILGMGMLSGLAGVPLSRAAGFGGLSRALTAATGVFSLVFGVLWGLPVVQSLVGS